MYRVSTWGKWEIEREELVASILADEKIQIAKEKLDKVLLEEVNTAMVKASFAYIEEHAEEFKQLPLPSELVMDSYQSSVDAVLASLSSALDIKEDLLCPHVNEFQAKAMATLREIFTDLLKIGNLSQNTKMEAISDLYGSNFKTDYPDLVKFLPYQDMDLIELAKIKINKLIQETDFGSHQEIIAKQLVYINEIAPQLSTSNDFQERFEHRTGKTLEKFKEDIAKKKDSSSAVTPFWREEKEIKTRNNGKGYNEDVQQGHSM